MNEIKCPQCGTVFKVDESGFADIVRQVRDAEFARAVEERAQLMEAEREQAVELALAQARNQAQADLSAREQRIAELEAAAKTAAAQRDAQVAELQGRLSALDRSLDVEKKLAAAQAQDAAKDELRAIERQRDELRMTCEQAKAENERLRAQHQAELAEKLALQTVLGTARLMTETGRGAEETRIAVCSPGGTTLAALAAMEEGGFTESLKAGVAAAVVRSKELARC